MSKEASKHQFYKSPLILCDGHKVFLRLSVWLSPERSPAHWACGLWCLGLKVPQVDFSFVLTMGDQNGCELLKISSWTYYFHCQMEVQTLLFAFSEGWGMDWEYIKCEMIFPFKRSMSASESYSTPGFSPIWGFVEWHSGNTWLPSLPCCMTPVYGVMQGQPLHF